MHPVWRARLPAITVLLLDIDCVLPEPSATMSIMFYQLLPCHMVAAVSFVSYVISGFAGRMSSQSSHCGDPYVDYLPAGHWEQTTGLSLIEHNGRERKREGLKGPDTGCKAGEHAIVIFVIYDSCKRSCVKNHLIYCTEATVSGSFIWLTMTGLYEGNLEVTITIDLLAKEEFSMLPEQSIEFHDSFLDTVMKIWMHDVERLYRRTTYGG